MREKNNPFFIFKGLHAKLKCLSKFRPLLSLVHQEIKNKPKLLHHSLHNLAKEHQDLFKQSFHQATSKNFSPIIKPKALDRRFKHSLWKEHYFFNFAKQSFLLTERHFHHLLSNLENLSATQKKQLLCLKEEIFNALSPSNFLLTNPEALQLLKKTRGRSLLNGIEHFFEDSVLYQQYFNILKSDIHAYSLGKNIALTEGKIVLENEIMQLIHYAPQCKKIYKNPLLIVPSFINKYYIFDLQPQQSLVQWLLEQQCDVYIISWINPDSSLRDYGYAEYTEKGPMACVEYLSAQHKAPINLVGYCLGGILTALMIAFLIKKNKKHWINSHSHITSRFDYTHMNRLSELCCVPDGVNLIEFFSQSMADSGLWDARKIAGFFNLCHSQEYYWSYFVSRYLKGIPPKPNPFLFWLQDLVHITESLARFYMLDMIRDNIFLSGKKFKICEEEIDLSSIDIPCLFIGLKADQLSLWEDVFNSAKLFTPHSDFILANGDHMSGAINLPPRKKYGYWLNKHKLTKNTTSEKWFENSDYYAGSFWPIWLEWIQPYLGKCISKRIYENQPVLDKAPGKYAKINFASV